MPEQIRIFVQVAGAPPECVGLVDLDKGDDGATTLRETAAAMRRIANQFDDLTTLYQLNQELDGKLR